MAYGPDLKARAKALALLYGSAARARELLAELDDEEPPSERAIQLWLHDPRIEPDRRFMRNFSASAEAKLLRSIESLLGPAKQQVLAAAAAGNSQDLLRAVRAWAIVADKVRPYAGS